MSKSSRDFDLGPAMPNIEIVQDIFIYYNVFKFHVYRLLAFLVIVQKHGNTHTNSGEYSIVEFCKNATV